MATANGKDDVAALLQGLGVDEGVDFAADDSGGDDGGDND